MRLWPWMLALALCGCSHEGTQQSVKPATAVPGHCEPAGGTHTWPVAGFASETPEQGSALARILVESTRKTLAALDLRSDVLRSQRECMLSSWEHFVVTKAAAGGARNRVENFTDGQIYGDVGRLGEGELWEVYWGGASRRHTPHGATSAFANMRGEVLVIVQWQEG